MCRRGSVYWRITWASTQSSSRTVFWLPLILLLLSIHMPLLQGPGCLLIKDSPLHGWSHLNKTKKKVHSHAFVLDMRGKCIQTLAMFGSWEISFVRFWKIWGEKICFPKIFLWYSDVRKSYSLAIFYFLYIMSGSNKIWEKENHRERKFSNFCFSFFNGKVERIQECISPNFPRFYLRRTGRKIL